MCILSNTVSVTRNEKLETGHLAGRTGRLAARNGLERAR